MAMAVLDGAIANIALPTIAHELGTSATAAIWVINIYQIAIVMLLLPFAAAGEIFGYRRVYLLGVALFVAASLGCSLAGSLPALVAWRFVQGVGAAAVMAINAALLRHSIPASQLGRGIGYNAIVVSITSAAGPTVAAAILLVASWHWIFAINVPFGLAALAIGWRNLPPSERAIRRFDRPSALLNAVLFGMLFLATTDIVGGHVGTRTAVAASLVVVTAIALVHRARTQTAPLIPIDLLRVALLRKSYLTSISAFAGQMTGLVALPFYLLPRFGHVTTGLVITALPIGVLLGAPLSGRLSDRLSPGPLGMIGLFTFALGYTLLALTGSGGAIGIAACLALAGFGFGLFQAPNNRVMIGEAPRSRSGAAAGMLAVCRMLGQTFGALAAALTFRLCGTGSSTPFAVAAGFAVTGALISATRLVSKAKPQAAQ